MRRLSALNCKRGDTIRVRSFLNDTDERHPHCHTLRALESDPAKRLAVNITIRKTQGELAEHWITTTGDMNVLKVNTIVDRMDEVPQEVSRRTTRRYFRQWKDGLTWKY